MMVSETKIGDTVIVPGHGPCAVVGKTYSTATLMILGVRAGETVCLWRAHQVSEPIDVTRRLAERRRLSQFSRDELVAYAERCELDGTTYEELLVSILEANGGDQRLACERVEAELSKRSE